MFRHLLITFTLLSLGAHAVFGCCLHHEHGECHHEQRQDVDTSSDQPHACCGHGTHAHQSKKDEQTDPATQEAHHLTTVCDQDAHSAPHGCDEARCEYLVDGRVRLDSFAPTNQLADDFVVGLDIALDHRPSVPPRYGLLSNACLTRHRGLRDLTEVTLI